MSFLENEEFQMISSGGHSRQTPGQHQKLHKKKSSQCLQKKTNSIKLSHIKTSWKHIHDPNAHPKTQTFLESPRYSTRRVSSPGSASPARSCKISAPHKAERTCSETIFCWLTTFDLKVLHAYKLYVMKFLIDALQCPCQKLGWGRVIPFFKGNIDNNGWISNKYCKNEVAHIYLIFFNQG